jgi:hypothetical protein
MAKHEQHEQNTTPERVAVLRAMPYGKYLQTPEWRRRRNRALMLAAWRCEWPGCMATDALEVHHRRYEHLGEEPDADLTVLCPSHHRSSHHRADTLLRLHWRVIRDVINTGPFESFTDFAETVKARFHALRIAHDPHELNETLGMALREVALDVPTHPRRVSVQESPAHISEQEARALLTDLRVRDLIRPMPRARLITRSQADQLKAMRLVIGEITRTMQRCDELEAHLEDVDDGEGAG